METNDIIKGIEDRLREKCDIFIGKPNNPEENAKRLADCIENRLGEGCTVECIPNPDDDKIINVSVGFPVNSFRFTIPLNKEE